MKLTEEQKKTCSGIAIYAVTTCVVIPLIHLFKGNFSWPDTMFDVAVAVIVALIVGCFLVIGMRIPKK